MKLLIHGGGLDVHGLSQAPDVSSLDKLRLIWDNKAAGKGAINTRSSHSPSSTSIHRKEPGCHIAAYAAMPKVSKRLRFEILRRDNFRCRYCGLTAADSELRVDHVIPEALGGVTAPANLAASCEPCNSGKSSVAPDSPVVDDVAEGALRWTHAMQLAAGRMESKLYEQEDRNSEFLEIWNNYAITGTDQHLPLPADWDAAVVRLRAAGLTDRLFAEAVAAAMKAYKVQPENRFRYFCGVAWNMITDLQKAAQDIVVGDEPHDKPEPTTYRGAEDVVARALDAAMDNAGISLESWQYDELVGQLALRLSGRA